MKFSILVPVYNVEKYLEQCVESLLNQTYKGEYEIILVDDGSTDSSGKICDKYSENHPDKIKVIHKTNGGHTSARLEAIKNAEGEYCLFCDSDDFVENTLLETVNNVLNDNPDTDMVIYSFWYYENSKKRARNQTISNDAKIYNSDSKQELYELLIKTPLLNSLWTKAIKAEIIKNSNIDYSQIFDKVLAEDAFMISHFLTDSKKIVSINKPLYNYRIIPESISRSYKPETIAKKNTLYVYYKFLELLPAWDMNDEEHIQKLNARWLSEVMYTFSSYYENVSLKDRKAVLEYNWSSMLPDAVLNENNNPYENPVSRSLLSNLISKNFFYIKFHFLKKKARKFIKKLLKRGI